MINIPPIIDLEITERCNFSCGFCFGPVNNNSKDLSLMFWKKVIIYMKNKGAKGIVFSGGEPTLFNNFEELVRFTKDNGLSIIVSSNGSNENTLYNVASYCDWISLPYDGKYTNKVMNGHNISFDKILEISHRLKDINTDLKIKLGSVSTKHNSSSLTVFAKYLVKEKIKIFDTWKIYQYSPRRSSMHLKDIYEISNDNFFYLQKQIIDIFIPNNLNLVFSSNKNRNASYLFVYPNGDLIIPNIGKKMSDIKLGNLLMDNFNIDYKKLSYIKKINHHNNFYNSYNL